jgi:hypothetical protein
MVTVDSDDEGCDEGSILWSDDEFLSVADFEPDLIDSPEMRDIGSVGVRCLDVEGREGNGNYFRSCDACID